MGETVRGYLVVKVLEAAGHNGEDRKVWDDSLKEAFVKSKFGSLLNWIPCLAISLAMPVILISFPNF
jgi:hypothetical protein